jgi:hypothetical protein
VCVVVTPAAPPFEARRARTFPVHRQRIRIGTQADRPALSTSHRITRDVPVLPCRRDLAPSASSSRARLAAMLSAELDAQIAPSASARRARCGRTRPDSCACGARL